MVKLSALSKGGVSLDKFIKLPILLITSIIYLITAISLRLIEIDLDRPYILFNPSFVNLICTLNNELCFYRLFYINLDRA